MSKSVKKDKIEKVNSFSVGGNISNLENGCFLYLYNEDKFGNETGGVSIHLLPDDIKCLVKMLNEFCK